MIFEIWDTETRNIVDAWEREDDALALVRDSFEAYGAEYVEPWALVCDDPDGDVTMIAKGAALAARAQAALSAA